MALILPIEGGGEVADVTRERFYSAPAALPVRPGADIMENSASSIELTGEGLAEALVSYSVRAVITRPAISSLDTGEPPVTVALGTSDAGHNAGEGALAGFETVAENIKSGKASLLSLPENKPLGVSLEGLDATRDARVAARAALKTIGQRINRANSALTLTGQVNKQVPASFEVGGDTSINALAGFESGTESRSNAAASVETTEGDGVTLLVEVLDDTLASGQGDC